MGRVGLGAVLDDGQGLGGALDGVVAAEGGGAQAVAQGEPDGALDLLAGALQGPAAAAALLAHQAVELVGVHGEALNADRILGEVQGEAVGVIELESHVAGEDAAVGQARGGLVQQGDAAAKGGAEALLLLAQGLDDHRLGAAQLGIGLAHLLHQGGDQAVHQGLLGAQDVGVAHGAAHDPAHDVAAALVGGAHAVGDQEAGGAQVVDDDLVRELRLAAGRHAGGRLAGIDQGAEEVDVVVGVDALQHGGDALEAHAGVDLRLGQVAAGAVGELLPLHEDVVPDLDEPVAVLVRAAGGAAGDGVAVVVEDLGVGAARAGVAHGPEVLLQPHDAVVAEAGDFLPQLRGVLVLGMDRDHQPVHRKAQVAVDEGPGQLDGAFLEVVAEGEVAEHLEEGLVAAGVADVVQVVVLAAGADALLRGGDAQGRRGLGAGEHVLERHHAGVDEQQGRIALRDQRRRRHHGVAVAFEVPQELFADVVQARHR